ncbi:MAG: hypothetical protein CENE_02001 [Candidatus Celerinatantimonas neptuna]|nr:MAG: hypothetical protein CENE_02001 [Candidatus Celerinatantimonas neptuna]
MRLDMTVMVGQSYFTGERYEIQARMGTQLIKFYNAHALEMGHQVGIRIDFQQI